MAKLNGIIAIIILLNLSELHRANAALESYDQKLSYPHKHVFYNGYASKEGNLVYAVCDDNKSDRIEYKCTIIQRQFPYDAVNRSCNVTLRMTNPENTNLTEFAVHALGQESAIVIWGEIGAYGRFNLIAVQLDSCHTEVLQLEDPQNTIYMDQIHTHKILTYNNSFDLIVGQAGVRMGFGLESQDLVFNYVSHNEDEAVRFISPIATRSPDKGYIYTTMHKRGSDVWMIKPDGKPTFLMSAYNGQLYVTSANYGYISACIKASSSDESKVICTQYDDTANRNIKADVKFDDKVNIMKVHTTPGGGFLLVTQFLDDEKAVGYDVTKVDSKGKIVGTIHSIGKNEEPCELEFFEVWENGDKYCATFVRQKTLHEDDLQISAECFSDTDFTT